MTSAASVAGRIKALQDPLRSLSVRQIAWLVFLSTLLIYFTLVPWVSRRWGLTGDEPHYLMVTHSLLTDGDLELSNNYQEKDFTLFYVGGELDPHSTIGPDGGAYPAHTIGLSVLLLPAYALGYLVFGTHAGVLYFLNTIGALLAANIYLLCYEVTKRRFSSLLGWVTTVFTVPLMHYAYQVYPEIMGALLLVWSLRHIRRGGKIKPHIWLMVGVCIGLLPWLVSRFILLSAFLGAAALFAIAVADGTARRRGLSIIALCLPVVALAGLLIAFNVRLYGSIMPSAGTGSTARFMKVFTHLPSLERLASGLAGWMFDENRGLLVYTPVYIIALPGLLLLLKDKRKDATLLALPLAGMYVVLAWQGFWTQWSIPVRYLVSVLPLLAVFIVYGVQRIGSRGFVGLGLALFVISLTTGRLLIREPQLIYAYRLHGESGLLRTYRQWLHIDVGKYVPSFERRPIVIYAREAAGEIGKIVSDPEAVGIVGTIPSTGYVAWAESVTEEAGYIVDRVWPSEEYAPLSPPGGYSACFRMKAGGGIPPERVVAVIEISTTQGLLAQREVTRGELGEEGYSLSCLQFDYPGRQRAKFRVFFTDEADLWVDWVTITHGSSAGKWILSGFWLAALVLFTGYYYTRYRGKPEGPGDEISSRQLEVGDERGHFVFRVLAALLVVLIIVTLGSYLRSLASPRVLEGEALDHVVGRMEGDGSSARGRAVHGDVASDEAGYLAYSEYEMFPPANYRVCYKRREVGSRSKHHTPAPYPPLAPPHRYLATSLPGSEEQTGCRPLL